MSPTRYKLCSYHYSVTNVYHFAPLLFVQEIFFNRKQRKSFFGERKTSKCARKANTKRWKVGAWWSILIYMKESHGHLSLVFSFFFLKKFFRFHVFISIESRGASSRKFWSCFNVHNHWRLSTLLRSRILANPIVRRSRQIISCEFREPLLAR